MPVSNKPHRNGGAAKVLAVSIQWVSTHVSVPMSQSPQKDVDKIE